MSSRKEEKERLRQEREQAEQAARASEARRKRLGLVLGGILAAAIVVIAVLALAGGGDDDGGDDGVDPPPVNASLPASKTDDLDEAVKNAKAAGCVNEKFEDEGNQHLANRDETYDEYKTNPPTSGPHVPPPSSFDGVYDPGNSPRKEDWVHSLEHGRVILMYKKGTPQERIDQLVKLFDEDVGTQPGGYKTLLMENNTNMPFEVAAVSWTRYAACDKFTDDAFDVLRAFRTEYVDSEEAPEAEFPWPFTSTS